MKVKIFLIAFLAVFISACSDGNSHLQPTQNSYNTMNLNIFRSPITGKCYDMVLYRAGGGYFIDYMKTDKVIPCNETAKPPQ